jgi:ABC-type antimicrobial peptide transport system permease subunit
MGAFLPGMFLSPEAILSAIGIMIGAGIIVGIFPAMKAMRLSIIDALARA